MRLAYCWNGALIDRRKMSEIAREEGNTLLADLLKTPLGGRRCEITGLQRRADLNGKTGVASRYLPKAGRYVVTEEYTREQMQVRPVNLKRRDRTPMDCGKFLKYMGTAPDGGNMWSDMNLFRSKEEAEQHHSRFITGRLDGSTE